MNIVYDQYHGEIHNGIQVDKILRNYFPDFNYNGVFFDVGAFDPVIISNSYHFEKNGWEVFCFEANPDSVAKLKSQRKNVFNYAISSSNKDIVTFNIVYTMKDWSASFSSISIDEKYKNIFGWNDKWETKQIKVEQKTLNSILDSEINVSKIDILSIDVEGGELNVLKGLDIQKYSPQIILVENVANDNELDEFIKGYGYSLDQKLSYNYFYKLYKDI
jgi:FkbM family methyltransferase